MMRKALLLVMSVVLTGCLVTVDSDSRQLQTVWNEADVTRLQIGISDDGWVTTYWIEEDRFQNKIKRWK